jgi:hypothetical protein
MEMQGINVFQQKFPLKNCRGFTMYDSADAPAIVINKSEVFALARLIPSTHRCRISLRSRRGGRFQGEPIGWMK